MSLLAVVLAFQAAPLEGPYVLLARRPETAYVLPLASLERSAEGGRAVLMELYRSTPDNPEARIDHVLELNCTSQTFMPVRSATYDSAGRLIEATDHDPEPEAVPTSYPPLAALSNIVCGKADVQAATRPDLQRDLPALIRGLAEY